MVRTLAYREPYRMNVIGSLPQPKVRQRLHERGLASTRFHDFETASKSMRFVSVYTEPFSPENPSRDGISERCTTC